MPDVLLMPEDSSSEQQLTKLVAELGMRCKVSYDPKRCAEWLKVRQFDAVLVTSTLSIANQEILAGSLWEKNPLAIFLLFDLPGNDGALARKLRLSGAEIAYGSEAIEKIRRTLQPLTSSNELEDPLRILVVEDLDAPRDIICSYVEHLGYSSVTPLSSAAQALEILDSTSPRNICVITDLRMPHMSGTELIERIRKTPRLAHVPIIALTAHGTVDTLMECLRAGASGFLVKPPRKDALRRQIEHAIRILHGRGAARLVQPEDVDMLGKSLGDGEIIH